MQLWLILINRNYIINQCSRQQRQQLYVCDCCCGCCRWCWKTNWREYAFVYRVHSLPAHSLYLLQSRMTDPRIKSEWSRINSALLKQLRRCSIQKKEQTKHTHKRAASGTAVSRVCDQTNTRFAKCINTQTSTIQVQFVQFSFALSPLFFFFLLFSTFSCFQFQQPLENSHHETMNVHLIAT